MPFPNTPTTTGQIVTSAFWNAEIVDNFDDAFPDGITSDDYNPTLSGTGGNASTTVAGQQYQVGAVLELWCRFTFITAGSGNYYVVLPQSAVGITASASAGNGQVVGEWSLKDSSAPNTDFGPVWLRAADEIWFGRGSNGLVTNLSPFAIAADDILSWHIRIPVA